MFNVIIHIGILIHGDYLIPLYAQIFPANSNALHRNIYKRGTSRMGGVAPGMWHTTSEDATYEVERNLFILQK